MLGKEAHTTSLSLYHHPTEAVLYTLGAAHWCNEQSYKLVPCFELLLFILKLPLRALRGSPSLHLDGGYRYPTSLWPLVPLP